MPSEWTLGLLLVGVGLFNLLFLHCGERPHPDVIQPRRPRTVMSLYVLVLLGGQAIGGPLTGWIVSNWGPHVGMAVAGGVPALAALAIGAYLARRHELRITVRLAGHSPRVAIVHRPAV